MRLSTKLGYAGLLPFFIITVMLALGFDSWAEYFQQYALLILCFMAGSSWGIAQADQQDDATQLGVSIGVFLVGFGASFLIVSVSLVLMVACFLVLLWLDLRGGYRQKLSSTYKRMRLILTSIVVGLHLVVLSMLWGS